MQSEEPFALLITWTCFGTWLPGDKRGYVSNTHLAGGGFLPKQNLPGTPYAKNSPLTRHQTSLSMRQPAIWMTVDLAHCVAQELVQAAATRNWRILRAAVMANHVHVVITDCPDDGPAVRRILKGTTQAKLSDFVRENRPWWTHGGSNRYLHGHDALLGAVNYVAGQEFKLVEIVNMQVLRVVQQG
ncbi:MAG: hypothetical protein JSS02_35745 [Planctomycetes bacterium]|nr:hypothetical protein [Planctomycetota bacterium]